MVYRSLPRLVLAALLVPLVLLIGLRSAWALYSCRIDGVVRTACCCHGKHEHKRPASNESRVTAASCCDVTVQAPAAAPDVRDATRASQLPPPAALSPAPVAAVARFVPRIATVERAVARPPPTATYKIKQSFLR